jgi:predicted CXXCH cytochrome family protein
MSIKSIIKFLFIATFLLTSFEFLSLHSFAAQENRCLVCHKNIEKDKKNIHPALKSGCETCHVAVKDLEHPKHNKSMKLLYSLPELCYKCHKEANFKGKHIHSPVMKGTCMSCHNAHSADFNKLLISDAPELCYKCHDKKKFERKHVHTVALHNCFRRCHNPHANDNPYCLLMPVNEICVTCHRNQETGNHIATLPGGFIHPMSGVPDPKKPSKEMTCASCHNPHSSSFAKLFYSKGKCKRCHKYY